MTMSIGQSDAQACCADAKRYGEIVNRVAVGILSSIHDSG